MAPTPLRIDEGLILKCIISYLKHDHNMNKKMIMNTEEETILNSLKLCNSISLEINDQLLELIKEEELDENLVYVRIYLLEKQDMFMHSFTLNMTKEKLRNEIFNWIEDKFEKIAMSVDGEIKLKELKNLVARRMKSIIEVDVEKTIELIDKWYDNDYSDQLIVRELSGYPDV